MWREAARYEPAMDRRRARASARALGRGGRPRRAAGRAPRPASNQTAQPGVGARARATVPALRHGRDQGAALQGRPPGGEVHAGARVVAHPRPGWVYELVRMILTPIAVFLYRTAGDLEVDNVPANGAVHPRAEPLLEHGPLLRARLSAAEDPVHGQVAASSATRCSITSSASAASSPSAAATTTRRRSSPPTRSSTTAAACCMYAEGGRSRTGKLGEPKPGVGRLALESGVPVVPVAIHGSQSVRAGSGSASPRSRSSTASR